MQQNILRESNVTSIYIVYEEHGIKKKYPVRLRFMDQKECYFSLLERNDFQKPKRKTDAALYVYTTDGIYDTKIVIFDCEMNINETFIQVSVPKEWRYTQLRNSTRKLAEMPVNIKYNDGYEINTTSYDISLGGVSFLSNEEIPAIYRKLPATLTLKLPSGQIMNFENGEMKTEAQFVRGKEITVDYDNYTIYVYKFKNVKEADADILKYFIMRLP